ncbi:MAG: HD domain-containing protein [Oscillospiraceae bacterium]
MTSDRFERQLEFLVEADKMKTIVRRTMLVDKSRRENDAEHSWHFALMAMILAQYCEDESVDMLRVLKMALVHDLIEVYAGDTFAYDKAGNLTKEKREKEAADRLFGILPEDQGAEIRALWEEFDAMETPDSRYAASIDRLQPFVNNYMTQGYTWAEGDVSRAQVYDRIGIVKSTMPQIWGFVEKVIEEAVENGQLKP